MTCQLCNSPESDVVSRLDRHNKPLITVVCRGCGLVSNDPIADDALLSKFYSEDYRVNYKGAHKPRKRQILRNFRRIKRHIEQFKDIYAPISTVLDIGAGSGEFLFSMDFAGKQARGIEPNKQYAEYCRQSLDLDVQTKELDSDLFEPATFDFIRLNHVLEHMNDPVRSLKTIAGFLKDDGVFYVEVPNVEVYARTKSRGNMFHFGHIFNFNPWTLRATAGLAGLVEDDRTIARCEETTGIFLKKAATDQSAESATNEANSIKVKGLIDQHYQTGFGSKNVSKPIRKITMRVEETISGWGYDDPKAIGEKVLKSSALN